MNSINSNELLPLSPFKHLMPSHLQELIGDCSKEFIVAGAQLFEAGQFDTHHYYLLSGELNCSLPGQPAVDITCPTLLPICDEQPRACSLTAKTDAIVLKVPRQRLDELLCWSQTAEYLLVNIGANREFDEDAAWLETALLSNLFLKVPPINIESIFQRLSSRLVNGGDQIIQQGDVGSRCYFIKEGQAEVTRSKERGGTPAHVVYLGAGRCFGEEALLRDTERNANVDMVTDGVLLELEKADFLQLLREPNVESTSWNTLTAKTAQPILIDVRTEEEYTAGHLPRAINIPLNLLNLKSRVLNPNQSYVVYCNTSLRSRTASFLLTKLGIKAANLSGGLNEVVSRHLIELSNQDYVLRAGIPEVGQ